MAVRDIQTGLQRLDKLIEARLRLVAERQSLADQVRQAQDRDTDIGARIQAVTQEIRAEWTKVRDEVDALVQGQSPAGGP